ncbi:diacylglycerol/lipid kinase family protein, partial [Actinomyces sp. MRS3W]|uniref:diacylglycerol/lipid kinase family protein n=1 Tax=Actinomyces sp. MRS3W TaxID=2800796 RepID=UPI0028FD3D05
MTVGTASAPIAAVVINPVKAAATRAVRQAIADALEAAGYRAPVWLETTARETGATQARLAVASGADLVIAAGGDGTVRSVAAGLAGTGTDMGIIPLGTANLAARNLGLPLRRYAELARIAAHGRAVPTDLIWVRTEPAEHTGPLSDAEDDAVIAEPPLGWARPALGTEHPCLVVAGIGFDAGLVASTDPVLKRHLSWGAYGIAALENLRQRRMDLVLGINDSSDDGDAAASRAVGVPSGDAVLGESGVPGPSTGARSAVGDEPSPGGSSAADARPPAGAGPAVTGGPNAGGTRAASTPTARPVRTERLTAHT